MSGLSERDPPPDGDHGGPRLLLAVVIALIVTAFVVLHLTGVIGPGSH